jgi:hypothetical protein
VDVHPACLYSKGTFAIVIASGADSSLQAQGLQTISMMTLCYCSNLRIDVTVEAFYLPSLL